MPLLAAVVLLLVLPLPLIAAAPRDPAPRAAASRAQVSLALQLTRTDGNNGTARVIGTPMLTTLDGNTGSIQIAGGELEYAISVSPAVEPENRVALLWTLQLSGKSLPGATSAALNGATRVLRGRNDPVVEVFLRDPQTGRSSSFRLSVKTTVTPP